MNLGFEFGSGIRVRVRVRVDGYPGRVKSGTGMVGYLSKKTGPVRFLPVPAYPTHTRARARVPRAAGTDGQGSVYPTRV